MLKTKYSVYLRLFSMMLLILGGLNWMSIGFNNSNVIENIMSVNYIRYLYILIGIAALYVAFDRTTFLPFLGWTVLPGDLLEEKEPSNALESVIVPNHPDAKKIVYWATNPGDTVNDPYSAYEGSDNAGVVSVLGKGDEIQLKLRCPKKYKVHGKTLPRHVHYRYVLNNNMISAVYTMNVEC
jgi:uncharacterized membrane protein YuzA (DUF378 family)